MKKILFNLFIISSFASFAQREGNHWYFGNHAGLDFTNGAPVAVTNGALYTDEGCASISDGNGQLLFYTNGIDVFNRNHVPMPNGFGLNGNLSSSQSALIVKKPGSQNEYYIFTTEALGLANGFCYSTVDMTLQSGLGDIVLKNQQLVAPSCEHLSGTLHSNGIDVWVMAHAANSNNYYAYLVTSAGVSPPVITSIGTNQNSTSVQGSMKFSPSGDKLACPLQLMTFFEVYDFDKSTGVLSNVMQLNNPNWSNPFAVEFSPSGRFLYAAYDPGGGTLLQFDLSLGSAAAIIAGAVNVGSYAASYFGSLQLGPDQKIYAGELSNSYLGVVNNPELAGMACNFVDTGLFLAGKISEYGLPNFVTNYFGVPLQPLALFSAPNHICPGTCTDFINLSANATSYIWIFQGANPGTSTDINPTTICYTSPGNYDVQLISTNANGSDTLLLANYITVYPNPAPQGISQSGDTLFANAGAVSYQWYHNGVAIPGATEYFFLAPESGDYNVVATDGNGCEVEAAIFDVVASVKPPIDNVQLGIFPNPVSDKLEISNLGKSNITEINAMSIYNMVGELVMDVQLPGTRCKLPLKVDINPLSQGTYFIEIFSGENIYRARFTRQ